MKEPQNSIVSKQWINMTQTESEWLLPAIFQTSSDIYEIHCSILLMENHPWRHSDSHSHPFSSSPLNESKFHMRFLSVSFSAIHGPLTRYLFLLLQNHASFFMNPEILRITKIKASGYMSTKSTWFLICIVSLLGTSRNA